MLLLAVSARPHGHHRQEWKSTSPSINYPKFLTILVTPYAVLKLQGAPAYVHTAPSGYGSQESAF